MAHCGIIKLVTIGLGNGLLPFGCQTVTLTNADLFSNGPLGINFSEFLTKILTFFLENVGISGPL